MYIFTYARNTMEMYLFQILSMSLNDTDENGGLKMVKRRKGRERKGRDSCFKGRNEWRVWCFDHAHSYSVGPSKNVFKAETNKRTECWTSHWLSKKFDVPMGIESLFSDKKSGKLYFSWERVVILIIYNSPRSKCLGVRLFQRNNPSLFKNVYSFRFRVFLLLKLFDERFSKGELNVERWDKGHYSRMFTRRVTLRKFAGTSFSSYPIDKISSLRYSVKGENCEGSLDSIDR